MADIQGDITDWGTHDISQVEVASDTHLENDVGSGKVVIIRCFEFAANPEAFAQHTPTKQELFNYHSKGIEGLLWADGMAVVPEVEPRIVVNKKQTKYHIFVGATPSRGHLLSEQPATLKDILTPTKK